MYEAVNAINSRLAMAKVTVEGDGTVNVLTAQLLTDTLSPTEFMFAIDLVSSAANHFDTLFHAIRRIDTSRRRRRRRYRRLKHTRNSLLSALSEEIVSLAAEVVPSTAIVTGQTRDFGEGSGPAWLSHRQHLVTNNHVVEGLVEAVWVRFPSCEELVLWLSAWIR